MRDVDNDIRDSLERLTDPHRDTPGAEALWGDLVARRRRRRIRNRTLAALPVLLVAVLAAGIFSARGSGEARSDVATGGADAPSSDGFDGSWKIVASVDKGERKPAYGSANLVIGGDRVQGDDGCGNRIDTSLNGDRIAPPRLRTQMACPDLQFIGAEGDLFWESLGHALEVRGGELWLVNDQGDGLIFGRVGRPGEAAIGTLRVENIQVFGNGQRAGGTERAVIVFNEPLPVGEAQYVADLATADLASRIVYTTQGPNSTHLCDSQHSVPDGAVGSVDLLVPAVWFADGEDAYTGPEPETVDDPAKFPVCGPHDGFIQYAMWSPLSADPADVVVTISPDRTAVTIEVIPQGRAPLDSSEGKGLVLKFLGHVLDGDLELAARMWTGYPEFGPDSSPADRVSYVEDLVADPTFARVLQSADPTTFVSPATDDTGVVVTLLDPRNGDTPPAAVAFLVGQTYDQGSADTSWRIHRLPLDPPTTASVELPAGSYVQPGQEIIVPGVPLEGGARAFANGEEISIEVDYDNLSMAIAIPDDVEGDLAVTVVTSSPELPGVRAFAVTVR